MIKILLADDEYHVISHLTNLLQQLEEFELNIISTCSGPEALTMVASSRIDMAFLDINMPKVNGLMIADKLHRQWPDCQIIFLTAYEVFDYIYEANQYPGAVYLLKAEPDKKLKEVAVSCCRDILRKREEAAWLTDIQQKEKQLVLLQEQQLLREMLQGNLAGDVAQFAKNASLEIHFSLDREVYVMLMNIRKAVPVSFDTMFYLERMERLLGNLFIFSFVETQKGMLLWIFQEKDAMCRELSYFDCLKDTMDAFLDICADARHQTVSLRLYQEKLTWEQLPNVYQFIYDAYYGESALEAPYSSTARVIGRQMGGEEAELQDTTGSSWQPKEQPSVPVSAAQPKEQPFGPISSGQPKEQPSVPVSAVQPKEQPSVSISFGQLQKQPSAPVSTVQPQKQPPVSISAALPRKLSSMKQALYQGNRDLFLTELLYCRQYCDSVKSRHHTGAVKLYFSIAVIFLDYIEHYGLEQRLAMEMALYPLYYINDFAGWEQAFSWLKKLAESLFRIAGENSSDKGRQMVASIQNYVQGHLGEELSLTVIANYVNYNESHVSRLFKRITGDNLTEYITAQRIAYARQLLERTEDTVQVISKKAGFHTSQYFSSAFRKSMGVSPNEYRLQNRRG